MAFHWSKLPRMVCNLQPDASFSLKPVGWPFRLCVVGNTRGDDDFLLFHFSWCRLFQMEEIRACFGIHIEACHNKRSGRQFTPLPCAEEMIPPALVAQQAAIAAAMSYVFIVGCFHDSKLIAISRGNAGILHYLLSALMVIASHRIRAYSLPKRPLRITFAGTAGFDITPSALWALIYP